MIQQEHILEPLTPGKLLIPSVLQWAEEIGE
nr:MAG TPA: hypothetical protein [Crassvirales sp.]